MPQSFSEPDFHGLCDHVGTIDPDLHKVIETYGYPPFWSRTNTFESLVHIILEQQVSLASAKAALEKLRTRLGNITPEGLILLTDEELKAAYFSRQKTVYARNLGQEISQRRLVLQELELLADNDVRARLTKLKGIGDWTVDIYLIMILQRPDVFPAGDLAVINALKQLKRLPKGIPRQEIQQIVDGWQPYRSIATMILWHYYLSLRANYGLNQAVPRTSRP